MYSSAVNDYTNAININPKKCHYYYMRGASENLAGQKDKAEKDFDLFNKYLQN